MTDLYKAEPQVGKPGHCFCAQVFGPKPERKDILTVEPTEDPAEATRIAKLCAEALNAAAPAEPDIALRELLSDVEDYLSNEPAVWRVLSLLNRVRAALAASQAERPAVKEGNDHA